MKKLLLAFMVFAASCGFAMAKDYTEGVDYQKVAPQPTDSGDKVEVLEFFWYGCPHCYHFEPEINAWKKSISNNDKVVFKRVPAVFRPEWKVHARTYYALVKMGKIEKIHGKIFNAIHKEKKHLNTLESMADFVAVNGVDRKKFVEEYNSFGIDSLVRKALKKMKAYNIDGVPMVVINGKYKVSGRMAGSFDNMIKIMNYLIEKESKQ